MITEMQIPIIKTTVEISIRAEFRRVDIQKTRLTPIALCNISAGFSWNQ